MKLESVTPLLRTHELRATVIFWTTALNFECTDLSEDDGWAVISRDGVEVMFAVPNQHQPFDQPSFTGSLYFKTDNVDEIWQVAQTRAEVCYPLEEFSHGMREFAIYDNNGYLLQFGTAVER